MNDVPRTKLTSIEATRAIAALLVVLLHAANLMRVPHFSGHVGLGGFFEFGYVGVDFFFVLSGFIITYVHHRDVGDPGSIPTYLWRRFSRIFPIYWIVLAASIALTCMARWLAGKPPTLDMGWHDLASTVFLMIGTGEPKYVGVAWSLQYELMFYVAFIVLLLHKRLGILLLVIWAASTLAINLGAWPERHVAWASAHCLQFLMGVAAGHLARHSPLRLPRATLWLAMAGLLLATWLEMKGPFGQHAPAGRMALGLASALLIVTLVGLEQQQLIRTPQWLSRLGSVSYSIYLGHILVINTCYTMLLKFGVYHAWPELQVYLVGVATALLFTVLLGLYVELPLVQALKDAPFQKPRHR